MAAGCHSARDFLRDCRARWDEIGLDLHNVADSWTISFTRKRGLIGLNFTRPKTITEPIRLSDLLEPFAAQTEEGAAARKEVAGAQPNSPCKLSRRGSAA